MRFLRRKRHWRHGEVKVEEVKRTEDRVLLEFTQPDGRQHRYWVPTKPLDLGDRYGPR